MLLLPLSLVYFMAVHMGDTAYLIPWVYPAAAAYSLLNISAASYNSFGPDLGGVQMYFLAPIRMQDVLFAKNLITFLTLTLQIVLTWIIVSVALRVPTAATTVTTILWFIFTITVNTAIGNARSLTAPKRVELGKPSGRQASPISAFMAMGILAACALLGAIIQELALYLENPWIAPPILALLACCGVAFYALSLTRAERIALDHREALSEELCKI
jgi:ABC-2 type transport system permease protein